MLKRLIPLLTGLADAEMKAAAARTKRNITFFTIITLATLLTVIFLVIAAYLALTVRFGPVISALLIAAICAVVAFFAFALNRIYEKAHKKRQAERRAAIDTNAALTAAAVAAVPTFLKRPVLTIVLPLAGLAVLSILSGKNSKKTDHDE
ncbi:hypothetical protein [Pseudochrobactrum sp. HB0163]|uniref:hypothetical protein n=1 Tax=Pseudochrobactrum sp. HB0163 TaxID=3450708 RepID=UPI003F6DB16A